MDNFQAIRNFQGVVRVSNFFANVWEREITFVFFVCPPTKKHLKESRYNTGFVASYKNEAEFGTAGLERIKKVELFLEQFKNLGVQFRCRCIWAAADSLIISPMNFQNPTCPKDMGVIQVVSNYQVVYSNLSRLADLYQQKPWKKLPNNVVDLERQRLFEILPSSAPENLKIDFLERVWSGFALDGILLREEYFGQNPVILGVEATGVSIFQNAGLEKSEWIPVIQL